MSKEVVRFETGLNQGIQLIDVKEHYGSAFNGSTIYRGSTPDGKDIVIKVSIYPWGAEREWIGINNAHQAGIATPHPISLILDRNDRKGIATSYIPGQLLYTNPAEEHRYAAGELIRQMHNDVFIDGLEWVEKGKKDFTFYDRTISTWEKAGIEGLTPESPAINLMKTLGIEVGNTFGQTKPVFLHNDLHDGQFIIDDLSNLFMIDFEFWKEGHAMGDLANYLYHNIRHGANIDFFRQLCKGYINGLSFSEEQKNALAFLLIFYSSLSLDYYQRRIPDKFSYALRVHRDVISFIGTEGIWRELE